MMKGIGSIYSGMIKITLGAIYLGRYEKTHLKQPIRGRNRPGCWLPLIYGLVLMIWFFPTTPGFGQNLTPGEIDELKELIGDRLDDLNFFNSVASFVNLNLYPDISSSNYDINNLGGTSISMIKFPFTYDIGPERFEWVPFIEGNFSYMKANSYFDSLESLFGPYAPGGDQEPYSETNADIEWTGYSALIGIGLKVPLSDTWSFAPSIDVAWSRFENETEFSGPGESEFQELLDGLATNWVLDAISYVGSLRFDYEKELDKTVFKVTWKYSYMYTEFRHDDDILNDFNVTNDIFTLQIDLKGPFGLAFKGNDLGWDLFFGHYRFEGEVGSLAGAVDYYNENGFFIKTDFAKEVLYTTDLVTLNILTKYFITIRYNLNKILLS